MVIEGRERVTGVGGSSGEIAGRVRRGPEIDQGRGAQQDTSAEEEGEVVQSPRHMGWALQSDRQQCEHPRGLPLPT